MGAKDFWGSWIVQRRVIGALIMRETYTRFGRKNLGFAWTYGEFLIFTMPVIVMWHFIRGHAEHGLLVVPFVWSGYLPILLFRHVGGHMLHAARLNKSLFYHRNVTPFDAIVARVAIEIFGNYGAAVFSFFVLYAIGAMDWPRNMPLLFVGYFYITWWCVAVGLIIAGFSERTPMFEKFWWPISYMYLPASGMFYMAAWLPPPVRSILLAVMPALPCYEMIRSGIFGPVIRAYYDIPRLSFILAALTLLGLLGLRDLRRYIADE
jgi:capsular polysaccharide transport system permease protein